jgi:predicted NUDIX family NTP pyrophosphohydrolase
MKESAGLFLWREVEGGIEVLVVHPSGAYNRAAPWGIPKGEIDPGEGAEEAARREVREETGVDVTGPLVSLGHVDYTRSRKRVHAFAAPLPAGAVARCASWEIDRAEWVSPDEARDRMQRDQKAFVDRLLASRPAG